MFCKFLSTTHVDVCLFGNSKIPLVNVVLFSVKIAIGSPYVFF